jgi:hypothetical protein
LNLQHDLGQLDVTVAANASLSLSLVSCQCASVMGTVWPGVTVTRAAGWLVAAARKKFELIN